MPVLALRERTRSFMPKDPMVSIRKRPKASSPTAPTSAISLGLWPSLTSVEATLSGCPPG
ncbi:MAG: hypothetical protein RAK25_00955 [TACK group archaeon]|nr:hypothetical protein [TACK group archaeon]